jgi:hypothetical protein
MPDMHDTFAYLADKLIKLDISILPDRLSKANSDTKAKDLLKEYKFLDKEASAILNLLESEVTTKTIRAFDIIVPTSNIRDNLHVITKRVRLEQFTRKNYNDLIDSYSGEITGRQQYFTGLNEWKTKKPKYEVQKELMNNKEDIKEKIQQFEQDYDRLEVNETVIQKLPGVNKIEESNSYIKEIDMDYNLYKQKMKFPESFANRAKIAVKTKNTAIKTNNKWDAKLKLDMSKTVNTETVKSHISLIKR